MLHLLSDNLRPTVYSFRNQPISRLERLAAESFTALGYNYVVYAYGDVRRLGVLPVPAEFADAASIIPEEEYLPDPDGKFTSFEAKFALTALAKHGGTWVSHDYLLLKELPDSAYLGIRRGVGDLALYHQLLRIPAGSFVAHQALAAMEGVPFGRMYRAQLMDEVALLWPLPAQNALLTTEEAIVTQADIAQQQAFDPVFFPDLSIAYGLCLQQDRWEDKEMAPDSKHCPDCLFETQWALHLGNRYVERSRAFDPIPA